MHFASSLARLQHACIKLAVKTNRQRGLACKDTVSGPCRAIKNKWHILIECRKYAKE